MSLLYDPKRQMLILLSLRLKQTYSYVDCKRDLLKSLLGVLYIEESKP